MMQQYILFLSIHSFIFKPVNLIYVLNQDVLVPQRFMECLRQFLFHFHYSLYSQIFIVIMVNNVTICNLWNKKWRIRLTQSKLIILNDCNVYSRSKILFRYTLMNACVFVNMHHIHSPSRVRYKITFSWKTQFYYITVHNLYLTNPSCP